MHHGVLPPNKTIDSDLYCRQLTRMQSCQTFEKNLLVLVNRDGVISYHDNSR